MNAKYQMTVEENIFVAKRNIVDYIWKSTHLEGIEITYSQTYAIYNGTCPTNMKVSDVISVNNLKYAWHFILDTIDTPIDLKYICRTNRYVGGNNLITNSGYLRIVPVLMGGTSWTPDMPDKDKITCELIKISKIDSPTERSITYMLYCMREQMFTDGNKRTGMLIANHEMIRYGCGIITVPIEKQPEFTRLLVDFYETNNMDKIKQFTYDNCIDGIDFRTQERYNKEQDTNPHSVESIAAAANIKYEEVKSQKIAALIKNLEQMNSDSE